MERKALVRGATVGQLKAMLADVDDDMPGSCSSHRRKRAT
jgi:hypothetical protein